MTPNSELTAKMRFSALFKRHWHAGRGRTPPPGSKYVCWNAAEFGKAMTAAGGGISDDTLTNWFEGANVPQPEPANRILKVFFPSAPEGLGDTADAVDWREMHSVWEAAWYNRRARVRETPPEPPEVRPELAWVHDGGFETLGLVEFRAHLPTPINAVPGNYLLPATLLLGQMTRTWEPYVVTISLLDATLTVASTVYQPAAGKLVGDAGFQHDHFERTTGGARITGPRAGKILKGDVLTDEVGRNVAEIEPADPSGEPLTLRVAAGPKDFESRAVRSDPTEAIDEAPKPNRDIIIKALIFAACRRDELGRAILAERRLRPKRPE